MTKVLVDWKNPRLLVHGSSSHENIKPTLTLNPGVNSVDKAAWDDAAKSTLFKHYIENDELVLITGKDGKAVETSDLAGLNEKDAKKVVASTLHQDLLDGWKKGEKRAGVLQAIEAQTAKLAKVPDQAPKDKA
jgi:hypothetical protein